MPRTARASLGNWCYHVLNRGNARADVFHKDEDYAAFVGLFQPACERLRMRILGYCLMPNHFHLVLRPYADGDLGRWMQWLMTSHVRRYHRHYGSSGHIWQGRFKAFPIEEDEHFLTVLRSVERNALRARLVRRRRLGMGEPSPPSGPRRLRAAHRAAGRTAAELERCCEPAAEGSGSGGHPA